jgi:hypothetical protein
MTPEEKAESHKKACSKYRKKQSKESLARATAKWRAANRERYLASAREYARSRPPEVVRKINKEYYQRHIIEMRQRAVDRRTANREVIFARYGGKCACCGENRKEFLTLHHTNNDGAKHRKDIGVTTRGNNFYAWVIKAGFPNDLQLLCYNCNCVRSRVGCYPHERERKEALGG